MSVQITSITETTANNSLSESTDGFYEFNTGHDVIEFGEAMMALLGILGNFLTYKAAEFLPQTNSSVLLKYLAVWDAIVTAHIGCFSFLRSFRLPLLDGIVSD